MYNLFLQTNLLNITVSPRNLDMPIKATTYKFLTATAIVLSLTLLSACGSSKVATENNNYKSETIHTPKKVSGKEKKVVEEAKRWLGTKYRYGGHSRSGTDCSGMVMEIYLKVYGIKLPRSSREQRNFCKSIKRKDLRQGDLVFFTTGKNKSTVSHVGIYIGGNEIIHASSRGVIVSDLNERYYQRTYHSSGRVKAAGNENSKNEKQIEDIDKSAERPKENSGRRKMPSVILDDAIDQKIDSIYSDVFY